MNKKILTYPGKRKSEYLRQWQEIIPGLPKTIGRFFNTPPIVMIKITIDPIYYNHVYTKVVLNHHSTPRKI